MDVSELIPVDNMKRRRETTQLFLGNRGLEKLDAAQMATFSNLSVLWLNDNKLTKLKGLDENVRLTALYLQNNRITSISSASCSLSKLRFLRTLMLQNNRIINLTETLGVLERLPQLNTLNLFGNPIAEEADSRLTTVHRLRALDVLDQHPVTPVDRERAAKLFSTARIIRKLAFGQRVEPWDKTKPQQLHSLSVTETWLRDDNRRTRSRQRQRAALDEHEAELRAHLPKFQYARSKVGAGAEAGKRMVTETISVVPKGHTPIILASFGHTVVHESLARLARDAGANRVILQCELWGIPERPLRPQPQDVKVLAQGELDWKYAEIVTAGREAEAYTVLLQKMGARHPTGREFSARLELFTVDDELGEGKRPLAVGHVQLAELLRGERLDGRLTQTVALHAPGSGGAGRPAATLMEVQATFEVNWSPYSTMAHRPSLASSRNRGAHLAGLTGDLTTDVMSHLMGKGQEGAGERTAEGIRVETVADTLQLLGCRANAQDVADLTAGLPEILPARALAEALGNGKAKLYRDAQRQLSEHMARGTAEPPNPEIMHAALRALRLHQDTDVPPNPPPARIRQRTATSHDMLATIQLKTLADVERFLPLVNLPVGEVQLDEERYRKHELQKKSGILAEVKPVVLRMSTTL